MLAGNIGVCDVSGSGGLWFIAACLAGVVAGPFLFFKGFRMLRYKRRILNTPLSKIHSAAIGLVEVVGTPTGPQTLTAPVTGNRCYYYRVQAWQWRGTKNGHEWKNVMDESCGVPFFLEDSTGRVLVDPQGAEMDVHSSFSDEIGAGFFNTRDLLPEHLRDFLLKRGLAPDEKIKVEEHIIQPGYPLFVFGTLGDNPEHGAWTPPPRVAAFAAAGAGGYAPAQVIDPAFDLHSSTAICRGERGDPFTVSWRSQKEVVESLAWKSTLCIWGGPALGIACLYLLLIFWKLLSS